MSFINELLPVLVLASLAAGFSTDETDLYLVQSEFGDSISCDMMAQGIFLVWWDNKNDLSEEASILLDSMMAYREISLDTMEMRDPPNPEDGFYFNVYLHEQGDVFPNGWACGVGTDTFGYPYMTLPIGVLGDWVTISHEAFHVFQYNSDAPGFEGVDIFWYIEASANWFAAITHPDHPNAFVEAMTLVKVPHVTMWLGYDNYPSYYPDNWQRYCHQYAMALFLYYLTEVEGMPYSLICNGFYNGSSCPQDLNPQEYLFQSEFVEDLRTSFMNWAAHMTNGFDFILPAQVETAELHWNSYADPEDDNQFTKIFDYTSPSGWYGPPDSIATTAWSFNTYKVLNAGDDAYSFTIQGSEIGSMGDPAFFRGKIVVQNTFSETRFYDLEMQSEFYGTLTVDVSQADTALYFIVGSLPEIFSGSEQVFPYLISVEPVLSSVDPHIGNTGELFMEGCTPNPFSVQTSFEFNVPSQGHASLEIYDLTGRLVSTLLDQEINSGTHELSWDGRDGTGMDLASGIYVIRLQHAGNHLSQRLTLLR